jgi:two-component system OmpR family response regulator
MSVNATILIVDDEVAVLHFFERILRHEGYTVMTAASGEAALRATADQQFDLALLDLKLKDMSGLDVLEHLRQHCPLTITIIITAHGSLETSIKALRQGVHDYLLKPCSADELRRSVQAGLLKRQQLAAPDTEPSRAIVIEQSVKANDRLRAVHTRGLFVDSIRHVISLDEVVLDLSPVEFHIVSFLLDEAPRVVSSEEIARVVQGYQEVPLEARDTIRSHIYHIRAKLKAVTDRDIIRTVRGVGYAVAD